MTITKIPAKVLVGLRKAERSKAGKFVDPAVVSLCVTVLRRRGEPWAESVLGRKFTRRSMLMPTLPWLDRGDEYIIVAADRAEDNAAILHLDTDY